MAGDMAAEMTAEMTAEKEGWALIEAEAEGGTSLALQTAITRPAGETLEARPGASGRRGAAGGVGRGVAAAGQHLHKSEAGMPIANSPWAGNSGGTQPGGSSDGRHPARSGARSALTAGPCSNSLVPIVGFQLPQRITRCTVPGAPGFTETASLDAMAPGAAFRSSAPPQPIHLIPITKRRHPSRMATAWRQGPDPRSGPFPSPIPRPIKPAGRSSC
jgi:hypothetical protein